MSQGQFYFGKTKVHWTCEALLDNRIISQRTELQEVSGWRLPAIICRLKHDYGWPIEKKERGPDNVTHYFLAEGTDRSKLRFLRSARALADQRPRNDLRMHLPPWPDRHPSPPCRGASLFGHA